MGRHSDWVGRLILIGMTRIHARVDGIRISPRSIERLLEVVCWLAGKRTGGIACFHRCGELTNSCSFMPKRQALVEIIVAILAFYAIGH